MVKITQAGEHDFELVAGIGRRTFYETWKEVNTEEDLQTYMNEAFDPEKIRQDLKNDTVNTFLLAHESSIPAGYAKLRNDRMYPGLEGPCLEIERIYVLKEYQDKKIGMALMDDCLRLAREGNCRWLWLGVNQENRKAIRFYERYGFVVFGTKKFQLGKAVDEDFLMKVNPVNI